MRISDWSSDVFSSDLWFTVFDKFSLWHIYNSWWFLLIMTFLVVSTTICLIRNTPKMVRDARSFREYIRASSIRAFHHRVESSSENEAAESLSRIQQWLRQQGYKYKLRQDGDSTLIAAKKGSFKDRKSTRLNSSH